jgi:hypothetical protein
VNEITRARERLPDDERGALARDAGIALDRMIDVTDRQASPPAASSR